MKQYRPSLRTFGACLALALVLATPVLAAPGDEEQEKAASALKTLLERPMMNTIPREKAVLRLRDLKAARQLERFLDAPQVNRTVIWALSEVGDAGSVKPVLRALDSMGQADRTHLGLYVASFRTPEVQRWLETLDRDDTITNPREKTRVRAARIRAGDESVLKGVLAGLKNPDPDVCAQALLALGQSQHPDYLKHIAPFATDRRTLKTPLKSSFSVQTREELPNGNVQFRSHRPGLATVAEVALEAASRALQPTTMEQIAWWYELEKGPRFTRDDAGARRLDRYVTANQKAARARCFPAHEAVQKFFAQLRASTDWGDDGAREVRDLDVTFQKKTWQITCEVNGQTRVTATVDSRGRVTLNRGE